MVLIGFSLDKFKVSHIPEAVLNIWKTAKLNTFRNYRNLYLIQRQRTKRLLGELVRLVNCLLFSKDFKFNKNSGRILRGMINF